MIVTLTMNPAVDKTVVIDNFEVNKVNRVAAIRLDAGGKGINVSKVIGSLGGKSKALGILAGRAGEYVKEELNRLEIDNEFVFVAGETRTNIKIVDGIRGTNTDINEAGPVITEVNLAKLLDKTISKLTNDSILVLSGSVPQNIDKAIYKTLILSAKERGVKTILDADGELLKEGLMAGPYLVKPNIYELERLFDKKINSIDEAILTAKEIFNYDVHQVVISLGGDGAIFMTRDYTAIAEGLKVKVISTVGGGDAMVAALALSLFKGSSIEDTIKLAIATSAASVTTSGTEPGDFETISSMLDKVKIKFI